MNNRQSVVNAFIAMAIPATALVSASPASAAPCPQPQLFQQPLLVPGAVWSFDVQMDLLHPENAGRTLNGSFALTGQDGDQIRVAWTMASEKQTLAADIFANKILTLGIANTSSGADLTWTPALVHFAYPLSVGQTWGGQAIFTGLLGGYPMTGTVTSAFTVAREEYVTTPAGTFDALVLVNDMSFPALHQQLQATLWVTSDGILIRRESRINGALVQIIALSSMDVPLPSMVQQVLLELGLLHDALARAQLADPPMEAFMRSIVHGLEHSLGDPGTTDLENARATLDRTEARLKLLGVPDGAPVLIAVGVIRNQTSLMIQRLDGTTARGRCWN